MDQRFGALLPKIARSLGKSPENLRYELSVPNDSFFLSSLCFVRLQFADGDSANLVVKMMPTNDAMREALKADNFFHDEILFYREFAKHFDNCPRHVYVEEKPPRDSVIVLENMESAGYKTCRLKVNATLDYALAAVRAIGRFHANGYIMKEKHKPEFFELVGKIRDSRFGERDEQENSMIVYINTMSPRPIRYLRKSGYDAEFCDKLEPVLQNAFHEIMLVAAKPAEPLATLCHGDFTLNNILFKEGQRQGPDELTRAVLVDYAMIRYSTPAIDLSTFLLLCCSQELRRNNLEVILRAYHESLIGCLREANLPDLPRFSYQAIYEDYRRRALFGLVVAIFFLPIACGLCTLTTEEMVCTDSRLVAEITGDLGGDEMSKTLADALLELKELGSLDHILQQSN